MAATSLTDALRETLAVFGASAPGTPLTTNEVADRLGIGRRSTYSRLDRLVDRDLVETKKVGARGRVWWRPIADVSTDAGADDERLAQVERELYGSLIGAVEEYAVYMLDPAGRVRTWNDGAARVTGYGGRDVVGEHVSTFYTGADREAGVPEEHLAVAADEGSVESEGWRVRDDGSRFRAQVSITAIRDARGELVGFSTVARDLTDRLEHERALRRERDLLERILETSPVAIGVFDAGGEALRVNGRFTDLLGVGGCDQDGYTLGDAVVLDEIGEVIPYEERPATAALETGRPVRDERVQVEGTDGGTRWLSVDAVPLEGDDDAVVVAVADVTQFEERVRRLARRRDEVETELQHVFDRVDDAFWGLDDAFRFTYVNDRAAELLEKSPTELVGANVWEALPWLEGTDAREEFEAAMASGSPSQYEDYLESTGRWYGVRVYPSESGLSVYFRDVTERKERKRRLEESERRNRTLVDNFPNGVVALFDRDLRHTLVGGSLFEVIDLPIDEVEGKTVREVFPPYVADQIEPGFRAVFDGESNAVEVEAGDAVRQFRTIPVRDDDGEIVAGLGMSQDVTERRRRERELERYETIVETVDDGIYALDEGGNFVMVNDAFCEMVGYDREELMGRHATVVQNDDVGQQAERLASEIASGERERATLDLALRSKVGETIPVESRFGPYPIGDGYGRCGVVRGVTERVERQRELERQRERLTALNELGDVVREITDAVIDQSTREEIERIVCERLADSDSYLFAWIGVVDGPSGTVNLRAEAGVEGYLEDVTITVDAADDRSHGPTGRALIEREIQVSRDVENDPGHDPWREEVGEYGFRSSVAIPILHDGTLFGALSVYADRPNAFDDDEAAVIGQLGEVVGHAIAAVERKQALMSDEVLELEFQIRDVFDEVGVPAPADGSITFEQAVPIGDGTFLVYGTATGEARDTLDAMVASSTLPQWRSVSALSSADGDVRFELRMDEPPVISTVASHGGYVHEAMIEDGDYYLRVHLAPGTDVRAIAESVQGAYPTTVLVTRQQVTRSPPATAGPAGPPLAELTDRQRTAIETAFYAGYFGWPRDSTGGDVAASLGIDPSTFHYHLREAQRKILGSVLGGGA